MKLCVFIFFATLSSITYSTQTADGDEARSDSVADSANESKDSPVNNEDEDAVTSGEDGDSAEEPTGKTQTRKLRDSQKHIEDVAGADADSMSSSSHDDLQPLDIDNGRKAKASARENLEKIIGRFVIDYLVSRLRAAKKRLLTTLLSPNESEEDKQVIV